MLMSKQAYNFANLEATPMYGMLMGVNENQSIVMSTPTIIEIHKNNSRNSTKLEDSTFSIYIETNKPILFFIGHESIDHNHLLKFLTFQ